MHGLSQMDLRSQEVKDMEVARRLQEQELMVYHTYNFYFCRKNCGSPQLSLTPFSTAQASKLDKRAAQVAQDEVSKVFFYLVHAY